MRKFGLIGHPLGHSLSPQIHARLFELSGETVDYQLYDISPEELKAKYDFLKTLDGFNITIPHKIAIMDFCGEIDETAQKYMTINCIKNDGGRYIGYNTDVLGFVKSVEAMGASLAGDTVLLGCGGVGRMMALETVYQGGALTIAVRPDDLPVAQALAAEIREKLGKEIKVCLLSELSGSHDLIVNSTPVGMFPKIDAMPVSAEQINTKFLFDAVYNPRETLLMKSAKERGAVVSGGMAMLVLQAVAAHEIWNGAKYNKADIDRLISDMEAYL